MICSPSAEGGSFDTEGNLWFVAIGSGWVSYLTSDAKLVPVFNCNPPPDLGQTCEPQGTRWYNGKLYLTTRHRGILVYDPQTKQLTTLVYTYRNQLFKGPNDLDFDADGNLFFTDPWATGPGPSTADRTGAVYHYSKDGVLRKIVDDMMFPNGIAVSPDNNVLAIGDFNGAPAVAHVLPLAAGDIRTRLLPHATAAVFITEAQNLPIAGIDAIAKSFDLTPAETRIMGLVTNGTTVARAAQSLAISEATAKTHLARIFSKTGVARQAERGADAAPGLHPGHAALFEVGDDLVGDLLVKAGPIREGFVGRRRAGHGWSPRRAGESLSLAWCARHGSGSALSLFG